MANNRSVGAKGEDIAAKYLTQKGIEIIERNYRCKLGEVDIIAKDNGYICFVEVKFRCNKSYGNAIEAVTPGKQRTIRKVAEYYLISKKLYNSPCRFDVIGIDLDKNIHKNTDKNTNENIITHIIDAF